MLVHALPDRLTVHAPAKLNLFLKIVAKRPDGFHDIETLMVALNFYDTLDFEPAPAETLRLICEDVSARRTAGGIVTPPVPTDESNLVLKAARLLNRAAGTDRGASIRLMKRIPAASGLAGGSSDCAATLVALNRLWNLGLSPAELLGLAAELGSDIGFFLSGSNAAICRGRGEIIEPFFLTTPLHVVVARPDSGLSTPLVYRHCRADDPGVSIALLVEALQTGRADEAARLLHNGLQRPAETLNADVTRLKELFASLPLPGHLMSGSGSAYFGLCRSLPQARSVAARLRGRGVGHVFAASTRS